MNDNKITSSTVETNPLNFFSGRGEDYEKYRPSHPNAAIDKILMGLKSNTQLVAADIGAGTGIGSRLLANRGIRVLAIEPNADMKSSATPHELVEFLTGTAEDIPLPSASLDLVTSFQAFHWFDYQQELNLTGLIGLAHSQGFIPQESTEFENLISKLSVFHSRYCNTRDCPPGTGKADRVRLAYRTRLYLATSV